MPEYKIRINQTAQAGAIARALKDGGINVRVPSAKIVGVTADSIEAVEEALKKGGVDAKNFEVAIDTQYTPDKKWPSR